MSELILIMLAVLFSLIYFAGAISVYKLCKISSCGYLRSIDFVDAILWPMFIISTNIAHIKSS